ncbi:RNA polymerase II transcription factor SIII subunit A-domain-containing protein [Roridomyces roridus]|uniref:RNA polymerase II transcription factor SIII subunit A-domain-containing protein n=1 Tax=Roridomyces roridus TaxID=1738132 RepID=A0AAD7BXA2_9AGAR|nr:RNA polymerase II transcription factor SIII subunit A-domain-containing protein [Roridomyces roridus]
MSLPDDRVPTLVQYCQRVASVHVDSISSLGDELRYDLVKPILERCTVDQLMRLEQASPYLQKETPEIWKGLCFRTYPAANDRYRRGEILEPDSWKEQYFDLVQEEARKFEAVGNKIRRQRLEAEERKKDSGIRVTTQQPTGKRRWGVSVQPKTLFQKTKSEASRLQKNMYSKPMLPPMPNNGKNYRVLPAANSALLPTSTSNSRVTVNTVVHSVSASGSSSSVSSTSKGSPLVTTSNPVESPRKKPRLDLPADSQLPKPMAVKRDPTASLFLPKHRAYSQRIK